MQTEFVWVKLLAKNAMIENSPFSNPAVENESQAFQAEFASNGRHKRRETHEPRDLRHRTWDLELVACHAEPYTLLFRSVDSGLPS